MLEARVSQDVPRDEVTIAFTGDTPIHNSVSAVTKRVGEPHDFRPMCQGVVERVGDEYVLHGLCNFLSGQVQSASLRDGVIAMVEAVEAQGRWKFRSIEVVQPQVRRGTHAIDVADGESLERTMSVVNSMGTSVALFESPEPSPPPL